jgi:2-polyprenyl-3-methyl-5-hydroxy-6-metoxy-1,4-benzoquinol methylase
MELEEIDKMFELEDIHWWFSAKRELIVDMIKSLNAKKILDVGCGTGSVVAALNTEREVVGCEYSEHALKLCGRRGPLTLVKSTAEILPFKDESFDAVTMLDVIEHLDKDLESLKEAVRVLKPDGHVIITVPAHMFLWQRHDILHHHKRRYSVSELRTKLEKTGFKITRMSYWNSYFFPASFISKFLYKGSTVKRHSRTINSIFHRIISLDNITIKKGISIPFGVTIFCIAKKV